MGVTDTACQGQSISDLKGAVTINRPGASILRRILNLIRVAIEIGRCQRQEEAEVTEHNELQIVVVHRRTTHEVERSVVLTGDTQFDLIRLTRGVTARVVQRRVSLTRVGTGQNLVLVTHTRDGFDYVVAQIELHVQVDTVGINLVTARHINRGSLRIALAGNEGIADALVLITRETDDGPDVAFSRGSVVGGGRRFRVIVDVLKDQVGGHPVVRLPTKFQLTRKDVFTADIPAIASSREGRANTVSRG